MTAQKGKRKRGPGDGEAAGGSGGREDWPGGADRYCRFVLRKENMDTQVQAPCGRALTAGCARSKMGSVQECDRTPHQLLSDAAWPDTWHHDLHASGAPRLGMPMQQITFIGWKPHWVIPRR